VSASESGPRAVTISQPVAASAAWWGPGVSWKEVVVRRIRGVIEVSWADAEETLSEHSYPTGNGTANCGQRGF
jgi:hypothetical protein